MSWWERWPPHPRPLARLALAKAKAAGWVFKPSGGSGHIFGSLRCREPQGLDPAEVCKVPVYSTSGPADGSTTARVIENAIRQCPHASIGRLLRPQDALGPTAARLSMVGHLLVAAEALIEAMRADVQSAAIYAHAVGVLDENPQSDVEGLGLRADECDRVAREALARGLAAATAAGIGTNWPPSEGPLPILALASDALARAKASMHEAPGAPDPDKLAEFDRLSARCVELTDMANQ